MGESEAYYRMIPSLHLSESNIKCIFVATGFPWNRSKFLRKIAEETGDKILELADEEFEQDTPNEKNFVTLPDRKGKFVEATPIHDKYSNRPDDLRNMCLAQFAINYDTISAKQVKNITFVNNVSSLDASKMIISWNSKYETPLPKVIKIQQDDKIVYMKLRTFPSVLRLHKWNQTNNPHEFFYSELVLYRPWKSESELHPNDLEACLQLHGDFENHERLKTCTDAKNQN